LGEVDGSVEGGLTIVNRREHAVCDQNVIVDMTVEEAPEAMHEGDRTKSRRAWGAWAVLAHGCLDGAQEHTQQPTGHLGLGAHVPAHTLRHRQNPLAVGNTRQDVIDQMRCGFYHAPAGTGRAHIAALAGEGDQELVSTAAAVHPRESMCQDAALQVRAKGGFDIGWHLAAELVAMFATSQPGLEVMSDCLVQNAARGAAWPVDRRADCLQLR